MEGLETVREKEVKEPAHPPNAHAAPENEVRTLIVKLRNHIEVHTVYSSEELGRDLRGLGRERSRSAVGGKVKGLSGFVSFVGGCRRMCTDHNI